MRVQSWLTLFEVDTHNLPDADRIRDLLFKIKGIALEWHGDEIEWTDVRDCMISRFSLSTSTPLIDAQRRRLKRDVAVQQYFRYKMRLLRRPVLPHTVCHQITEGLPFSWKLTMTSAKPGSANAWVETAQQLETHFASIPRNPTPDYSQQSNQFNVRPNANLKHNPRAPAATNDRSLPACRICEQLGPRISYTGLENARIATPTSTTKVETMAALAHIMSTMLRPVHQSPLALTSPTINQSLLLI